MNDITARTMFLFGVLCLCACAPSAAPSEPAPEYGTLQLSLGRTAGGVTAVQYNVTCAGDFQKSTVVSLDPHGFFSPNDLMLDGRTFADLFLVAPTGDCTITVQAMRDADTPATNCAPVTQNTTVTAGETQEETLIVHCTPFAPEPTECADDNVSPQSTSVSIDPPEPYGTCSPITFTIEVDDPDNATHTFDFVTVTSPDYDDALIDFTVDGMNITVTTPRKGFLQIGGVVRDCPTSALEFGYVVEVTDGDDQDFCP